MSRMGRPDGARAQVTHVYIVWAVQTGGMAIVITRVPVKNPDPAKHVAVLRRAAAQVERSGVVADVDGTRAIPARSVTWY